MNSQSCRRPQDMDDAPKIQNRQPNFRRGPRGDRKKKAMRKKTMGDNTMRKTKIWLASLFAILLVSATAYVQAQDTAKVHGHAQDPVGVAVPNATVQLS